MRERERERKRELGRVRVRKSGGSVREVAFVLCSSDHKEKGEWSRGHTLAMAQNFARTLMDTPSNHMTPTMFVDTVSQRLGELEEENKRRIEVNAR